VACRKHWSSIPVTPEILTGPAGVRSGLRELQNTLEMPASRNKPAYGEHAISSFPDGMNTVESP
jgi:hypothetical protein